MMKRIWQLQRSLYTLILIKDLKTSEGRHWAVADNRIYSRAFSKLKDHGSFALGRRKKKETWLY